MVDHVLNNNSGGITSPVMPQAIATAKGWNSYTVTQKGKTNKNPLFEGGGDNKLFFIEPAHLTFINRCDMEATSSNDNDRGSPCFQAFNGQGNLLRSVRTNVGNTSPDNIQWEVFKAMAKFRSEITVFGVPKGTYPTSTDHTQSTAVAVTFGGTTSIMNNGDEIIFPGDPLCWDVPPPTTLNPLGIAEGPGGMDTALLGTQSRRYVAVVKPINKLFLADKAKWMQECYVRNAADLHRYCIDRDTTMGTPYSWEHEALRSMENAYLHAGMTLVSVTVRKFLRMLHQQLSVDRAGNITMKGGKPKALSQFDQLDLKAVLTELGQADQMSKDTPARLEQLASEITSTIGVDLGIHKVATIPEGSPAGKTRAQLRHAIGTAIIHPLNQNKDSKMTNLLKSPQMLAKLGFIDANQFKVFNSLLAADTALIKKQINAVPEHISATLNLWQDIQSRSIGWATNVSPPDSQLNIFMQRYLSA